MTRRWLVRSRVRWCEPARATTSALQVLAHEVREPCAASSRVRLALYRSWLRWPVRRAPYQTYQVPEYAGATRIVSPRFVRYAHEAGIKVQVWTVDDETDMRRLLEWGVDGLITNRPDVGVRVRDEFLATKATRTV